MKNYVVGLMYDYKLQNVLLLLKSHPTWQAGRYNGPGGQCNPGEITRAAVVREVEEETGIKTKIEDWALRVVLFVKQSNGLVDMEVSFYIAVGNIHCAKATTDEIPKVFPITDLPNNVIHNLRWIIPISLDNELDFPLAITIKKPG